MDAFHVTLTVIGSYLLFLMLLKVYVKVTMGWDKSPTCLVGKTAIVTGANVGIGFYTAQDFAKRGARVILACRDAGRGEAARKKIIETTGNTNVVVRLLDLSSLSSVRKFVIETKAVEERLDILVNNAGATNLDHSVTADGLNIIMQINYFGPFLLTVLLIGLLKQSAPSRIVNVASISPYIARLNVNNLNAFPRVLCPKPAQYGNAKLCNVLFTFELARRLKGTGVDTNCLHPGVVQTDIFRHCSFSAKAYNYFISKLLYKTPEEGAQTTIYVAVSKDLNGISGEYFADCRKRWTPKSWKDERLAKKLWEKTVGFVKLRNDEKL